MRPVLLHLIAAARPNFMKVAPLYHRLRAESWCRLELVHTGQHYDPNMSDAFFRDLGLPEPDHHLGVGSGSHAEQTGGVMIAYEHLCLATHPDWIIVVGDVNSTLACTLVGAKLGIKVAHLEAGLRSRDRRMPEEINRIVTDALADLLWTPSPDGDENLRAEGVPPERIQRVGNIMIDSYELLRHRIEAAGTPDRLGLRGQRYGVVTLHRPVNVDDPASLRRLVVALCAVAKDLPLVFPVHPRTRQRLVAFELMPMLAAAENIRLTEPMGYVEFMGLVSAAAVAITDSGGIQEETTYLGIPCLTLRDTTERPITVTEGTNRLVTVEALTATVRQALRDRGRKHHVPALWDGHTAERVVASLKAACLTLTRAPPIFSSSFCEGSVVLVQADDGSETAAGDAPPLPAGLKILHVLDHSLPMHSGYSFRSIALLREQRRRGWRTVHLTTPKHTQSGPSPEMIDGYAFHRTPAAAYGSGLPGLGEIALIHGVARRIEHMVRSERPDVIHAHSPVLNALAALRAGRRTGVPVVYEVRAFWEDAAVSHGTMREGGIFYRLSHALETHALRQAAAVTTICAGLRQDMLSRGIAADHITVIPNGVDTSEFRFGAQPDPELRAALGLDGRIVLGFLGSFYSYEGLDLLLSALPLIRKEHPTMAVLLVGGGPEEVALKEQARRLHLDDAVRFVGRVPHGMIQRYYDLVDIFVYPRHPMRLTETTTPLKPLEAMARGGIVLASDVGGHRELVRDGETGYLFKAGNIEDFTRAVSQLIARKEEWPDVARTARQFVERERSWTATTAGYSEAYARALRAKQRR